MIKPTCFALTAALAVSAVIFTGCFNLKKVSDPTHSYVLSSLPVTTPLAAARSNAYSGIGIARVDLPAYLLDSRIAVRHGTSEIRFSELNLWAERLDKGLQRVLGDNLALLLPADRVLLSAWRRQDVAVELHVAVQRFESDQAGNILLEARWRLTTNGGEETLAARQSRITKDGPPLMNDPAKAVEALSDALGEFSKELASTITSVAPPQIRAKQ